MVVIAAAVLVIAFLALEWFVWAALLRPLPGAVRCVFALSDETEPELEHAVRAYRFLKKHGMIRGELTVELGPASAHTRRAAEILARSGELTVIEKEE